MRLRLHIYPEAQIDDRLLPCEAVHSLAKELCTGVDGSFGLENAGH